jgi:putative transposase
MHIVEKVARGHRYLYLAEGGRVRQRLIRPLGRKDHLLASGQLERLLEWIGRHCDRGLVLSQIDSGEIRLRRIGGPLLFGALWKWFGIAEVLEAVLAGRQFGFAVERAVFTATLHWLFVSGSDRDCAGWMTDYAIEGADELALHHLYRAVDERAAEKALAAFEAGPLGQKYPAIGQSWRRVWQEVIPFFAFPAEVRKIIYTTNSIEALNSKLRRAVRARGHFPNEEAATKLLYLILNRSEKEWKMPPREWTLAKPQFGVLFGERFMKALVA